MLKIGDFAKKFNVTVDTLRYYIEQQLLLPHKKGTQYSFSQEDSKDMEEILDLKKMGFSLIEIHNILSYKRLVSNRTREYRNHLRSFLESKKQQVEQHQKDLCRTLSYIDGKINELNNEDKNYKVLGIPLFMLTYLACPHCKSDLILTEGAIENNMVVSGHMYCKCNYKVKVEKGIIINEEEVIEKTLPTKQEYFANTSSKYINFLYTSMASLISFINSEDIKKRFIMELGHCPGFFLSKYFPYLPKDSTYILIDQDPKRMESAKIDLELHYNHDNFLFLCCDIKNLPLKEGFIDLIINSTGIEVYRKDKELLLNYLGSFVSNQGFLGGIYPYFSDRAREGDSKLTKLYNKDFILQMLDSSEFHTLKSLDNGPISEAGIYSPHVDGSSYFHYIYLGKHER